MQSTPGIRLQKYLADRGVASRRHAEAMMVAGRVAVNGRPVTELGTRVDPDKDTVAVDGVPLETTREQRVTLMLNKPRGYECAAAPSGAGLRSVYDLLRDVPERVVPAGRLDADSEGLLLFSNDGDLIHRITHPRHGHRKIYEVDIAGRVTPSTLGRLGERMEIDGYQIEPVRVERMDSPPGGNGDRLRFTLGEGRNRQIRKMCGQVGLKVLTLRRVAITDLHLGALPIGTWRFLTDAELKRLTAGADESTAGVGRRSPSPPTSNRLTDGQVVRRPVRRRPPKAPNAA